MGRIADKKSPSAAAVGSAQFPDSADGKNELGAYLEYNKILRSWFVAFGVGGPALFMINPQIGKRLADAGDLRFVSAMFLAGAGCQVFGALLNKISNWYVYRGAGDDSYRLLKRFKFCRWLVQQFWLDVLLDSVTIAAYAVASWELLTVFGSG